MCLRYYVKGKTIVSDASWLVTFEDKEWIDETGKTSDISATKWLKAGYWNFNEPSQPPSAFKLPVVKQRQLYRPQKETDHYSLILEKKHLALSNCMV